MASGTSTGDTTSSTSWSNRRRRSLAQSAPPSPSPAGRRLNPDQVDSERALERAKALARAVRDKLDFATVGWKAYVPTPVGVLLSRPIFSARYRARRAREMRSRHL